MKKLYPLLLLMLILSLPLIACALTGEVKEKAVEKAVELEATAEEMVAEVAESTETPVIEPTATPMVEPTATPVPEEEKEEAPLPTATSAPTEPVEEEEFEVAEIPDWIETYRMLLTMEGEGTEEGKTTSGSAEIRGEYIVEPPSERILITSAEEGGEPQTMESIAIENTTWLNTGEGWMQMQMDEQQGFAAFGFGFWDTEQFVGGMEGFKRIRPDKEVNGVPCEHYAFDESALAEMMAESMGGVTAARGEVWISKEDRFVVKYTWHLEGEDIGPEGGKGVSDWSWEIYDINAPITIEPPATAEEIGATGEFPMMPDAQVTMAMGTMTMYTTASLVEEVVVFYEREMATAGWTQEGETTQMEAMATMQFTKEGQSVNVTIMPAEEEEGSQVMLTSTE